MTTYDYNLVLDTPDFEVRIDAPASYGYWEFKPMNGVGGKFWLGPAAPAAGEVLAGDGIPGGVVAILEKADYAVDAAFIIPDPTQPKKERRRA